MKEKTAQVLNQITQGVLVVLALFFPLAFWNLTTEFFDTPKLLLLLVCLLVLLLVWALRSFTDGKLTITKTFFDLPLVLFLAALAIAVFFAPQKTIALLGNFPQISNGAVSLTLFIFTFFILVGTVKQFNLVKQTIYLLITSGAILAVLSLLAYFGLNVFGFSFTKDINFTPLGSSFSLGAYLTLVLPLLLGEILDEKKDFSFSPKVLREILQNPEKLADQLLSKLGLSLLLVLFLSAIAFSKSPAVYIGAGFAVFLSLVFLQRERLEKNLPWLLGPFFLAFLLYFLSLSPLGGARNILHQRFINFPAEKQLSFINSWKVSISTFRDLPLWGSGPGSYLFDFTNYKPIEFNSSPFWNSRFSEAFNEYLQILAVLGAFGLITFLLITAVFSNFALKALVSERDEAGKMLAVSGLTFFVLLTFHAASLALWVIGVMLLSLFFIFFHTHLTKELKIGVGAKGPGADDIDLHFDALPTLLVLGVLGLAFWLTWQGRPLILADFHHRQALNALAANNGLEAYNQLTAAEQLSPNIDLYHLDLAQTNLTLANAIVAAKGPTEASPAGSLSDTDKQNVQTFLSQAINEGKMAVTLSPNNPAGYEVLASIYNQIQGVAQNALAFALDAYGRAIQKDPLNPNLRLLTGNLYHSLKNNDLAVRFFTDAINLKPDFAPGYYNLAAVLKDKGDFQGAVQAAEQAVSLFDPQSSDYKTAADLLAQLKDKVASETARLQTQVTPTPTPAAKPSSALENQKLPKVVNLPKPENIASPGAVKKSP